MANAVEKKEKVSFIKRVGNFFKRIGRFFKNMWHELKKVSWPSKKDLVNYSLVVIGFVVVLAVIVGLLDTASSSLVKLLIQL